MQTLGKAYIILIKTRVITQIVMFPIQVLMMIFLEKALRPFANKYLYEEINRN